MIMEIGQVADEFMKIAMMKSRHKFEQFIIWHVRLFSKRENVNSTWTFNFEACQFWTLLMIKTGNFDVEFWKTIWILGMKFWKSNLEYWKLNSWHATRILENTWSEITLGSALFLALTRFSNSLDWIRFHHNCSSS